MVRPWVQQGLALAMPAAGTATSVSVGNGTRLPREFGICWKRLQGERLSHAKAATQVLMQTGRMCVSESNGCDWARTVDEPILSRATFGDHVC